MNLNPHYSTHQGPQRENEQTTTTNYRPTMTSQPHVSNFQDMENDRNKDKEKGKKKDEKLIS